MSVKCLQSNIRHTLSVLTETVNLPIKAFGIVIFSHIRSRISRPESCADMACIMSITSEFTVNRHDDGSKSTTNTNDQSTITNTSLTSQYNHQYITDQSVQSPVHHRPVSTITSTSWTSQYNHQYITDQSVQSPVHIRITRQSADPCIQTTY